MKVLHSLYAKIFFWFWVTITMGSLFIILSAVFTVMGPFGRNWMRLTQGLYAKSAVDFYESGGKPALEHYLAILRNTSDINGCLLDEKRHNLLGGPLPPHIEEVLDQTFLSGESGFRLGRIWTGSVPVDSGGNRFYFVLEVDPLHRFFDGKAFALPVLARLAALGLLAAAFCFLLTRHLVAPIRALQTAALRLAAGDLSSRVSTAVTSRSDELADTARAFDQMADHIQLLLHKRQELLADISHELRSPLTRLSVSLELMRRGEIDVVEKMETDLGRMNTMIGQILLLTRLDLQANQAGLDEVNLTPMLQSIAEDAEFEAHQQDKRVTVAAEGDCIVRGDANLLRSCLENIVRNAVYYTDPQTSVEVNAGMVLNQAGNPQCQITVRDCGPGVPESALPFLFDPFYRVSESRDLREGGVGLGLSISRRITELHHGTIRAMNRTTSKGLEIRILLALV